MSAELRRPARGRLFLCSVSTESGGDLGGLCKP